MPPLLLGTLLLLGLLTLSAALGRRLLCWLGLVIVEPAERLLLAAGLGLGLLQFVPFTLFVLGIGHPPVMRLTLALLALALSRDAWGVVGDVGSWLRTRLSLSWMERLMATVFAVLLGAIYLRALCPITDCDGLVYHLTAAVRYLEEGRFVYLSTLTYTNWPLGIELLFCLPLSIHPQAPVGIIQFLLGGLTVYATCLYGRRLAGRFGGVAAPCLLLLSSIFWWEMTAAHIDLGTALFATLAVFSLSHALAAGEQEHRWLVLSGLFAGLAATTKMNCVLVIVLVPFLFLILKKGRLLDRARAALVCSFIAGSLVIPWLARTWVVTGNPLYPVFHEVFGGQEWTADGWERFHRMHLLYDVPLGLPATPLVVLGTHGAIGLAGLGLCLLTFWFLRRSAYAVPACFAVFFATGIFVASYYNMRFLLAAQPCAAICGAGLLRHRERLLGPVVCCLGIALAIHIAWSELNPDLATAAAVACGQVTSEVYLREQLPDYPVVEFANQHLPADARILVSMWETNTALYRAHALSANYWLQDCIHYDSPERLEEDLCRLGVTHLVLTPDFPDWCDHSRVAGPRKRIEAPALVDLARRHGTQLLERNRVVLYELHLDSASTH